LVAFFLVDLALPVSFVALGALLPAKAVTAPNVNARAANSGISFLACWA